MDRMDRIVTEDIDKQKEEATIKKALDKCGYPSWSFDQVKKKMQNKTKKSSYKEQGLLTEKQGHGSTSIRARSRWKSQ